MIIINKDALRTQATPYHFTEVSHEATNLTVKNSLPSIADHALIIPYRNRSYHLERFVEEMGPYLRRNFPNDSFSLWIIEQADDQLFNRGWLANVGIVQIGLAQPHGKCIIFHDVDLLPERDGVPYNQCNLPSQLSSEMEHFKWRVPYPHSFGGVVTMHMDQWREVNGFSNDYVGWGGEDDDLYERVRTNGLLQGNKSVSRPPKGSGRFKTTNQSLVHHPSGIKGKDEYAHSTALLDKMKKGSDRWKTDGLSDLHYTIVQHEVKTGLSGFASVHRIMCIP